MQIVLPGALPASGAIAAELAKQLPEVAPTLCAWLDSAAVTLQRTDLHRDGCTAYEAWQLRQAGFHPAPGQALGAGLGPLLHGAPAAGDARPIWIADLVNIALGPNQAALLPADRLDLSAEDGAALYDAARPLFVGTPFDAQPLLPWRWRVEVPESVDWHAASPAVVAGERLDDWWPQDAAMRPWRRLINEIQMAWHDHAVNERRAAAGLPGINGLWLYGGARPWPRPPGQAGGTQQSRQAPPPAASGIADGPGAAPSATLVLAEDLLPAHEAGDWARWLDALRALDARLLAPLADAEGTPLQAIQLLLLGRDRGAVLALKPRPRLLQWLPRPHKEWKSWWSLRA
jgi:hypothetical protein